MIYSHFGSREADQPNWGEKIVGERAESRSEFLSQICPCTATNFNQLPVPSFWPDGSVQPSLATLVQPRERLNPGSDWETAVAATGPDGPGRPIIGGRADRRPVRWSGLESVTLTAIEAAVLRTLTTRRRLWSATQSWLIGGCLR